MLNGYEAGSLFKVLNLHNLFFRHLRQLHRA